MEAESEDPQFDSFLGGPENLPHGQNLSEFLKRRMEEVVMLTEAIDESPFRGQAFQRLPKHMRRRQMSHYIKRLPRRLQRPYLMSLKDGLPAPTKRPSRKYRRKPSNLLLEYNRRQKTSVWLETHIWHAKRFHMGKHWGYKLPEKPVNKSFKACYRAISEHCLLIDQSYHNCIELEGPESELCDGLRQCTSPECGLSFCAKMYLSGQREGRTTLFHPNSYPYRVIGDVRFMWQPAGGPSGQRKIWIWVHPLLYGEVVECLQLLFGLSEVEAESGDGGEEGAVVGGGPSPGKGERKAMEVVKLEPRKAAFVRTAKYSNQRVTLTSLKDTLNRFQLSGPLSHAIVCQAFTVASVESEEAEVEAKRRRREGGEGEKGGEGGGRWWGRYYEEGGRRRSWAAQKAFYGEMSRWCRPTDVPSGMILGLVVEDPRLKIPRRREKATPALAGVCEAEALSVEEGLSDSAVWLAEVRDEVSAKKLTTEEINRVRSRKIVPGLGVEDGIADERQSRVPILLVQRPGRGEPRSGKLGLGSGWDIIAPAGFGMPIWLSLIFRGARTGGLRESKLLELECKSLSGCPPPDSAAGESDSLQNLQTLTTRYFKLPPNKRANFVKLGVRSPFYPPWRVLVKDWVLRTEPAAERPDSTEFSVLRDYKALRRLEGVLNCWPKGGSEALGGLNLRPNCLVPVVVECCGKGRPRELALLSLPADEDLKDLSRGPREPSHEDENERLRKALRQEHLALLRALKRRRRKERAKVKELGRGLGGGLKGGEVLGGRGGLLGDQWEEYRRRMEGLWLPEVGGLESVVGGGSRSLVGYVVRGEFSYARAQGLGLGYVTVPGLMRVLEVCGRGRSKAVVLVRNRNEVQYRFARLRIAVGS